MNSKLFATATASATQKRDNADNSDNTIADFLNHIHYGDYCVIA